VSFARDCVGGEAALLHGKLNPLLHGKLNPLLHGKLNPLLHGKLNPRDTYSP
jgi:hypothetical protein